MASLAFRSTGAELLLLERTLTQETLTVPQPGLSFIDNAAHGQAEVNGLIGRNLLLPPHSGHVSAISVYD